MSSAATTHLPCSIFPRPLTSIRTHPSPQRTPVLFQAGASKSGIDFAGQHGEALYTDNKTFDSLRSYIAEVRASAISHGRDPYDVKVFMAFQPFLGKTLEEAQAKYNKAYELASVQSGLAKLSGFTGVDLSKYPLKEPFTFEASASDGAITGVIKNFNLEAKLANVPFTPESLGKMAGFAGVTCPVGTPEMVADEMAKWLEETDVDGKFPLILSRSSISTPLYSYNRRSLGFSFFVLLLILHSADKYSRLQLCLQLQPRLLRGYCRPSRTSPTRERLDVARLHRSRWMLQRELAQYTWKPLLELPSSRNQI